MVTLVNNIPSVISDRVEDWVTGTKIPWFYFNHTLGVNPKGAYSVDQDKYIIKDLPRFTHYFFPNSKTLVEDKAAIQPLTEWIKANYLPNYDVKRVMGNLTTQMADANKYLNIPHVDSDADTMYTFLYYVNSSDGKTVFFKDRKIDCEVDPIKGTGALFPSNVIHAGQIPHINTSRYVINIIFSKRD
jgi:hypothetical protein